MSDEIQQGFYLLGPFNWLLGHNFPITLLLCLLLSPVGMILVGLVGEARLVPLSPRKQFLGFMPGDIFLGIGAALLLTVAQDLPYGQWYNNLLVHQVLLGITMVVALVMTIVELVSKFYPFWAIVSPTKLYHNFLLYGGYGYMIVLLVFAGGSGIFMSIQFAQFNPWNLLWYLLALVALFLWMGCNKLDTVPGFLGQLPRSEKAKFAHIDKWWLGWTRLFGART